MQRPVPAQTSPVRRSASGQTSPQAPAQKPVSGQTSAAGQTAPAGKSGGPGIKLQWKAPAGIAVSKIAGYYILRADKELGPYKRINESPVKTLSYDDKGLKDKAGYFYEVCTVLQNGTMSRPTKPVGIIVGSKQTYAPPRIESFGADSAGKVRYAGETAFFNMSGTPGDNAVFSIEGQTGGITTPGTQITMKEITPGVYRGAYTVARGVRIINGYAAATLSDDKGGQAAAKTGANLDFIGMAKPAISGLYASRITSDSVCVGWPRVDTGEGYYNLYRDTSRIVDASKLTPLSANMNTSVSTFIDDSVKAGTSYYYVLVYDDLSGAPLAISDNLEVNVPWMHVSFGANSVHEDSGGKTLKPGDVLGVTVNTAAGGKAAFSISNTASNLALTEGPAGVYKGAWTIKEGDGIFKSRVAVNFTAPDGRQHSALSATLVSVDAPKANQVKPAVLAASVKTIGGRNPVLVNSRNPAGINKKLPGAGKPVIAGIKGNVRVIPGPPGRPAAGKKLTVLPGKAGRTSIITTGGLASRPGGVIGAAQAAKSASIITGGRPDSIPRGLPYEFQKPEPRPSPAPGMHSPASGIQRAGGSFPGRPAESAGTPANAVNPIGVVNPAGTVAPIGVVNPLGAVNPAGTVATIGVVNPLGTVNAAGAGNAAAGPVSSLPAPSHGKKKPGTPQSPASGTQSPVPGMQSPVPGMQKAGGSVPGHGVSAFGD